MTKIVFTDDLIGDPLEAVQNTGKELAMFGNPSYDAASQFSEELALWSTPIQSADQEILPEMGVITPRVRDVTRNDSLMRRVIRV
jgi:capsid protein